MSRFFPSLYGNDDNAARIGGAIVSGTLSHAYILEGPDGSGKLFFAKQIAAALACDHRTNPAAALPCGKCPHCNRILGVGSPDVRVIAPGGASIGVEIIRELRQDMYLSSTEEAHKVYIFERAHTMTPQAQNALLKVLEEPPTDLLILLLTDSPDALLTTIRSRTQSIRMHLLTGSGMEMALASHIGAQTLKRKDPDGYAALIESAAGRLGYILPRLEEKSRASLQKERAETEEVVEALLVRPYAERIAVQNALPGKRPELIALLERVMVALRDLVLLLKDESAPLLFYIDKESAIALAEKAGVRRILAVYDCVCKAKESLSLNANTSLTILSLFTEIDKKSKKSPK